jgi:peptidoglycan/LPS O-acetylase OafA/YrhL
MPRPMHNFIRHGYLSVDPFFVLSGFVMALTYGAAFAGEFSGEAYGGFLYKRLGRVYPLYLIASLVMLVLLLAGIVPGSHPSGATLAFNVFLAQAWGFADSIDSPGWSISTEFGAYLLFPVLVTFLLRGRLTRALLGIAAALATLAFIAARSIDQLHQATGGAHRSGPLDVFGAGTPYPLLRCVAGFALGLAAFRLAGLPSVRRAMGNRFIGDAIAAATIWALLVRGADLLIVPLFTALVIALPSEASATAKFLGSKSVYFLGLISYSLYLVHVPLKALLKVPLKILLDHMHVPFAQSVSGCLLLIPCVALAAITYYSIEKPARNWSRQIAGLRRPRLVAELSSP